MHSVTDRQTDGQQDDANSRSYCVSVRSAKNSRSDQVFKTTRLRVTMATVNSKNLHIKYIK